MGRTRRPATDEEARALASSLRLRILRVCLGESHTNQEIARAVGRDPASILHHVRRLVDTGFLIAEPARRGTRGSREIPYLATGKSWQIETPAKGKVLLQAFLEEVALVSATDLDTARLGLRLGPEDLVEFKDRLADLLDEFEQRPDDPGAAPISVFVAIHPDVTRTAPATSAPARPTDQRAAVPST
ncbi:MAG: winged helix-turn-helix domain-containing protein [Actinomycetota bacterium]|nr:winged helix-turn-helix domain-containing protein [Actinomycetota bacterium]